MKYTHEEIEVFKLRARIRKLEKDLQHEVIQGNLFPAQVAELQHNIRYEMVRLRNRLQQAIMQLPLDSNI